jgi:hypothetical protein
VGNRRGVYRILVGKSEGKRALGYQVLDGRIILKWIFKMEGTYAGLIALRIGASGESLWM